MEENDKLENKFSSKTDNMANYIFDLEDDLSKFSIINPKLNNTFYYCKSYFQFYVLFSILSSLFFYMSNILYIFD